MTDLRPTHHIGFGANGTLIASIELRDGESYCDTKARLNAEAAAESDRASEHLTIEDWYTVALLNQGDSIPEGWGVVYQGHNMGFLPNGAEVAITEV